jgi:hypothetical protein
VSLSAAKIFFIVLISSAARFDFLGQRRLASLLLSGSAQARVCRCPGAFLRLVPVPVSQGSILPLDFQFPQHSLSGFFSHVKLSASVPGDRAPGAVLFLGLRFCHRIKGLSFSSACCPIRVVSQSRTTSIR